MSLEVKVERALNGDCIWIRYGGENISNIIIDSGPSTFAKGFRCLMNKVIESGEKVDLLVLTHIDDDHIKGFSKYIENNDCKEIKKIWFNGCGSGVYLKNQTHSPRNVTSLIKYMEDKGLNVITPVCEGYEEYINGANLKVITPQYKDMLDLADIIDKNAIHSGKSYNKDLDSIFSYDIFHEDKSPSNKASISFVFTYEEKKIAFLGDAHASDIIDGKNKYFKDETIDLVKLAHHGSKYNINRELLECLGSEKFIISRKGPVDKETLARITNCIDNSIVYCNYNWWSLIGYFTRNDENKYIDTDKLIISKKNIITNKVEL